MKFPFALTLLLAAGNIQAAELSAVQFDKSAITFVSKQMNVPVEGAFKKFSARIRLDPAKPEAGQAQIDIDLASIDVGSSEANDEVKGKSWFNVREFPTASFVSSSVRALGGGRYETSGRMSIKGKTVEIRAPFTLRQDKDGLVLAGSLPIKRLEFGIGSGVWSDTSTVADEVQVKFHIVLK